MHPPELPRCSGVNRLLRPPSTPGERQRDRAGTSELPSSVPQVYREIVDMASRSAKKMLKPHFRPTYDEPRRGRHGRDRSGRTASNTLKGWGFRRLSASAIRALNAQRRSAWPPGGPGGCKKFPPTPTYGVGRAEGGLLHPAFAKGIAVPRRIGTNCLTAWIMVSPGTMSSRAAASSWETRGRSSSISRPSAGSRRPTPEEEEVGKGDLDRRKSPASVTRKGLGPGLRQFSGPITLPRAQVRERARWRHAS